MSYDIYMLIHARPLTTRRKLPRQRQRQRQRPTPDSDFCPIKDYLTVSCFIAG